MEPFQRVRIHNFPALKAWRKAVAAAKNASPFWQELGWPARVSFLRKAAELMTRSQFELAALMTLEVGKNRTEAIATARDKSLATKANTALSQGARDWAETMFNGFTAMEHRLATINIDDFDVEYGAWYVATKVDEKPTWHSTSRGRDGYNWIDYENKRVDEIIDTARVMSDFKAAKVLWKEFQQIIHKEQPYTFVAEPKQLNAYAKSIRNVMSAAVSP